MTDLERIQIARAEEQMESVSMEPTKHDRWQIRGEGPGRMVGKGIGWRRERCLGCGKRTWRGTSYCQRCGTRVKKGLPFDFDLWTLTHAERKRVSTGMCWGLRPSPLAGRSMPGRAAEGTE